MIPHLKVAAGILVDDAGRTLVAERVGGGPFHGMWEFPGGKIGADESAADALHRELHEELGIQVTHCAHFMNLYHEYADRRVTIDFYLVTSWQGQPDGLEGQRLEWLDQARLDAANLLPADAPVIESLRRQQILS